MYSICDLFIAEQLNGVNEKSFQGSIRNNSCLEERIKFSL